MLESECLGNHILRSCDSLFKSSFDNPRPIGIVFCIPDIKKVDFPEGLLKKNNETIYASCGALNSCHVSIHGQIKHS